MLRASGKQDVMKRYHQEMERTKRVHRQHLRDLHQWPRRAIDCVCEFQVGRFRKKKALGCGKSRCLLCHFDKIFGLPSLKDPIRQRRFLDSVEDYCLDRREAGDAEP